MKELAIVTSCCGDYGKYLDQWAGSILALTQKPGEVAILTHGDETVRSHGVRAAERLEAGGILVHRAHHQERLDLGDARNRAVALSSTPWVMHFDCDDALLPHALEDFEALAPGADVIGAGYERSGDLKSGPRGRRRLYSSTTGLEALDAVAPCSGVSPFRRTFWERSPYRTDMKGAWDTALWIGFARLGARFRPTTRPVFLYNQHADSVFNRRRTIRDWTRAHVEESLRSLRRNDRGVSVIVPRALERQDERLEVWRHVRGWWQRHFPEFEIVEGFAPARGWKKGEAIADALTRATGRILVIADADCVCDPQAMRAAVEQVESGGAPWAIPHLNVLRLTQAATAAVLEQPLPAAVPAMQLERPAYQGIAGGGFVIVPRIGYLATGGIPAQFTGWGSEDNALALILGTFLGPALRGRTDCIHLWHPPQDRKGDRVENMKRLRMIRSAAAQGRDHLFGFLHAHAKQVKTDPIWKRKASQLQEQRLAAAKAAGRDLKAAEPVWRRKAREAADRRAAERKAAEAKLAQGSVQGSAPDARV